MQEGELSKPDVTPVTHPDHHTVGHEFMGGVCPSGRWFCESHDQFGYWMYLTDGSGQWHSVSERAIGRTYHEIYELDGSGRKYCSWGKVRAYGEAAA